MLVKAKIEVLIDVRSNPNSRWASFTNKENLRAILRSIQIQYIYLGDSLGGHPSDPDSYDPQTGKVDYQILQGKEYFKRGIRQILVELENHRVCIMCAEEDPSSCHRNLLVAESLRHEGIIVLHIRGDGRIQTDEEVWKESVGVSSDQYSLPL